MGVGLGVGVGGGSGSGCVSRVVKERGRQAGSDVWGEVGTVGRREQGEDRSRFGTEADSAAVEVVVRERRPSEGEEEAIILSEAGARAARSVSEAGGGR